jgi:hypothetical protein
MPSARDFGLKSQIEKTDPPLERVLYLRRLYEEETEILKYKWIESEKAGFDIGLDRAIVEWTVRHRSSWRKSLTRQRIFPKAA